MTPTVQVIGWLQRVHDLYREVEFILQKAISNYRRSVFSVAFLGIATPATDLERK